MAQRNNDNKVVGGDGDRNLSKFKKLNNAKSKIQICIRATKEPTFLTPSTKKAFNQLKQVFTKVLTFQYFDLKWYIWIKTNASGYAIGGVLSQLTFDHLTSNQD